jgi:tetratricopeptide (TPR) repeat protein
MLACCPDAERALIAYAHAKVKVGQARDAVTKLSAALPSFDESIPVREALAAAHEGAGDNAKMQSAYREIAELYKRRGDNDKARDILQRFVPVASFGGGGGVDTRNDVSFMDLREQGVLDFSSDELGTGSVSRSAAEPREPRKPKPRGPRIEEPVEGEEGYDELIAQARMESEFGDPNEARRFAEKALELQPGAQTARDILGSAPGSGDRLEPIDEDDTGTLPDIELVLVDENDDENNAFSSVEPPPEIAGPRPTPAPVAAKTRADEIEIDLDDLDLANADLGDLEADEAGRDEVGLPPMSSAEPPAAPPAQAQGQAASASWAQQSSWVVKTVKAAEAIFAKGMLDEAQMLYEQVLEHAPQHPQALLRIGEIAARKGGDLLSDEQSFEDTFVDRDESMDEPPSVALGQSFKESTRKPAPTPKPAPVAKPVVAKPVVAKPAPAPKPAAAKPKPAPAPKIELGDESFDALLQSVDDDVRSAPAAKAAAPATDDAFDDLFAEEASADEVLGDPSDIDDVVSVADEIEDDVIADTDLGSSSKRKSGEGDSSTDVSIESAELHGRASDDDDVIVVEPPKKPRAPEPIAAFDPSSLADEDELLEAEEVAHDEDGFDLAAELDVAHAHGEEESAPDFADIFSAFKKGIEQQLSAEDAAAHYDLAIAYKEMGLLSDAVGALEKVQKAGPLGVEGISLLATCKLEMGQPEAAIGLLVKALGKAATNGEKIALRYDLALAFSAAGQREEALTAFQEVAKQDPSFREVQAQIEELSG